MRKWPFIIAVTKPKCYEEITVTTFSSEGGTPSHNNPELKEKESENAVKNSKSPRFLRKEKSHGEGESTEKSTVSTGKQRGIGTEISQYRAFSIHSRDQQLCKFIGTRGSVYISGVLFVSLLLNFIGHRAVHEGCAKRLNEK